MRLPRVRFTMRRMLAAVVIAACLMALVSPVARRWLFDPTGLKKLAADHAFMARYYNRVAAENPRHKDVAYYREMAAYFDRTSRAAQAKSGRSGPSGGAGW